MTIERLSDISVDVSIYLRSGGELTRADILEMVGEDGDQEEREQAVDQILHMAEGRLRRPAMGQQQRTDVAERLRGLER